TRLTLSRLCGLVKLDGLPAETLSISASSRRPVQTLPISARTMASPPTPIYPNDTTKDRKEQDMSIFDIFRKTPQGVGNPANAPFVNPSEHCFHAWGMWSAPFIAEM